ncbi:2Fe-2S iron-sulfur cluster-binding protein [Pseudomonas sp. SA3-5]|uniref:2Fe-2S iron-sulfur cluster-binding protein n=1 Tax=Pseudomonas aestuarii TaxID=3018340 RepID=A0ABT4XDK1_9PSED|nr:2Fe-2S iron-sulfur cluster-binding protein [Pseudomonas aestuarii]MDA7086298.1 2Fe-2S iron-sulfur cluster-binding protein [Pseudomonas aestuarii]
MPTLTLIEHNGTVHQVTGEIGQSVMQAAMFASVPGIQGDCGGACSCATCHAYVDDQWQVRMPEAESTEADMLEYAVGRRATSRLTCQLVMSEALDGLVLHLPESQY